ncbi:MAG: exodeoxyribonuclease VII small subunit [Candidatus Omnitrophica bacterium]|nr:exodeoxyribonuclease VII small subunit [Candidatus Omnitrophota bacterium]
MPEEIKFEKAMDQLSRIVEELESGEVSLEDAIKKYEEGVRLSKACQDQLAKAEKKIEVLSKSLDGSLSRTPFEESESRGEADSSKKGSSKKAKTKPVGNDEDILF